MTVGLISIGGMVAKKIVEGDLVVMDIKEHFDKYLVDIKKLNIGNVLVIDGEIEIWPKMIESLYQFMLENDSYEQIVFGKRLAFKGYFDQYLKQIEVASQQDTINRVIQVEFESQYKSEQQVMAQLVI